MVLVDGFDQGPSAWRTPSSSATKLASFEPVAIQAVTGAGAPSRRRAPLVERHRGHLEPEAHQHEQDRRRPRHIAGKARFDDVYMIADRPRRDARSTWRIAASK